MKLFESASKIVFLIIAVTASAGFLLGILEAKDFMVLAISAFSYYFSKTKAEQAEQPEAKPK